MTSLEAMVKLTKRIQKDTKKSNDKTIKETISKVLTILSNGNNFYYDYLR